ncbi:hypothetical protein [Janthinobacterium sp.]|nr:hypothetical protein [Janthinobacterium sp.]
MSLALSLRYGGGDLDWFAKLPRSRQIDLLALQSLEADEATERQRPRGR